MDSEFGYGVEIKILDRPNIAAYSWIRKMYNRFSLSWMVFSGQADCLIWKK